MDVTAKDKISFICDSIVVGPSKALTNGFGDPVCLGNAETKFYFRFRLVDILTTRTP
jgi:hypothetical protein